MVEHYEDIQALWNGDRGRTYMFQNEIAANPPWPEAIVPGAAMKGYPAYQVGDKVNRHEAWGLGSYFFISQGPAVVQARSFKVPDKPGIVMHNVMSFTLGTWGKTEHVINDFGPSAAQKTLSAPIAVVREYPTEH